MPLQLFEIVPASVTRDAAEAVIAVVADAAAGADARILESQVAAGFGRVFAIVEPAEGRVPDLARAVHERLAGRVAELAGPHAVRLVGADVEQIRATAARADYLVEWDIPDHIDMDTYLARKAANSPKYAEVPEVSFLRTYVREDTEKCLCFYDAPDEAAVVHAREVVATPIDRLHRLDASGIAGLGALAEALGSGGRA